MVSKTKIVKHTCIISTWYINICVYVFLYIHVNSITHG